MHQLQRIRIEQVERNARHAEHVNLAAEQPQIGASLMIDKRIAYQRYAESGTANARAHIDVFRKHLAETADALIHIATKAHVERARHKLFELHLAATNAAGGKERCH